MLSFLYTSMKSGVVAMAVRSAMEVVLAFVLNDQSYNFWNSHHPFVNNFLRQSLPLCSPLLLALIYSC
jgi:hypothetical protein